MLIPKIKPCALNWVHIDLPNSISPLCLHLSVLSGDLMVSPPLSLHGPLPARPHPRPCGPTTWHLLSRPLLPPSSLHFACCAAPPPLGCQVVTKPTASAWSSGCPSPSQRFVWFPFSVKPHSLAWLKSKTNHQYLLFDFNFLISLILFNFNF